MAESKKKSNPISKFGTSQRESSNKQYISPKHQKSMPSSYSQESYYGDLAGTTSMGKMPSSKLRSSSNTKFSKANRFDKSGASNTKDVDYGDTEYGSTGKQINSKKQSSPSFGFGTQERDRYNKMYLSKQHAAKSISSLTSEADFMGETSGMVSDFFRMFFSTRMWFPLFIHLFISFEIVVHIFRNMSLEIIISFYPG